MKRIVAFVVVLLMLFSLSIAAYADLGDSDFKDWSVITGPAGFSFVDVPYIDTDPNLDLHDYLKPGTKLWVHDFDKDTKKYLLVIDRDSGHKIKGCGFVNVTEAQLDKYFTGEKKAVKCDYATKLDKKVECVVTPSIGLVLRQGPDVNYPSFRTIPQNTKLTYQYVQEGEKYNWAYVSYKGQDGWCCIDYTETIEPTKEATTEATTETTTEATTETTTETTAAPTTEATTEPTTASISEPLSEETQPEETAGFFGSTNTVILVCCLGAVILALTAVVILLIVKRKKNS